MNKGNNKIIELRAILQRESQNSYLYKQTKLKMYKDKEVKKCQGCFFVNVWRKNIFDIYVTEYGTALTTILPILWG
jgi:hypothetical protein